MIDLAEMIIDPDFCTTFKILRQTGIWQSDGTFSTTSETINCTGIVRPASGANLAQQEDGDENQETLCFFTREKTYLTDASHLSDIFIYNGKRYKATGSREWKMHGFYKTTAEYLGVNE